LGIVSQRLRVSALAVAALAAVSVLSSCSSHTSPGAAALVGSDRISTGSLQSAVNAALANPQAKAQIGSNRPEFTRELLAKMISDKVVASAAAAHHVTVSSTDVSNQTAQFVQQAGSLKALQTQAAQGGVPVSQLPAYIRSYALEQKLEASLINALPVSQAQLQAAYDKNKSSYQQVDSAHILVKTKALGEQLLAKVKAHPSQFAALAKRYSIDTGSKDNGGNLGFQSRTAFVKPFADAIFTNKPGTYVLVHSQYGYHVIHVIAKRTQSLASVTPQLKASLFSSQGASLLSKAIVAESQKIGVHVSPRYGTWNAAKQTVDATESSVSSSAG
jgi:parvulin-like peptidyl-prolyl isomerase